MIFLFSNFADEVLEIPVDLSDFHNRILVRQSEPALELTMFGKFLSATDSSFLSMAQCAELIIPLYLGGTFAIENMKLSDNLACWEISAQLLAQARSVDEGTYIDSAAIARSQE